MNHIKIFENFLSSIDSVRPRMQPGISIDWSNHLDVEGKRSFISNTTLYFDSSYSPFGTLSYATSVSDSGQKYKMTANILNKMVISEIKFRPIKGVTVACTYMLPPTMPKGIPLSPEMTDDFNMTVSHRGETHSVSTNLRLKERNNFISVSFLRQLLPKIFFGAKIMTSIFKSHNAPQSVLAEYLAIFKPNDYNSYILHLREKEINLSYQKSINKQKKISTSFSYDHQNFKSFWWAAYTFDFQNTGSRVSASIDSDFKATTAYSFNIGNLPLGLTVSSEVDPLFGKHKLGLSVQYRTQKDNGEMQ